MSDTLDKIAAHVEAHRRQGRATFSTDGIQMLLDLVKQTGPLDFRAIGYTNAARQYPMDDPLAVVMFAAWVGVEPDKLPEAMRYNPNQWSADAWARVASAARKYLEGAP